MDELALRTLLNNLEASRSSLHVLLHIFNWFVVFGLGFDLFVIIKEFRDDWKEFIYGEIHPYENHLPKRPSLSLLILALLGTALIVIGVAGELSVDVQTGKIETQIREANDNLLGLIIQEAGDAKTSAEGAANAASRAQASTEKIDADLAQTEWIISARRVQDVDGLTTDLKNGFKRPGVVLRSYIGDEEGFWLCTQLVDIAKKTEMAPQDECATEQIRHVPITDLLIRAPSHEEALNFSKLLKRPGRIPGYFVGTSEGPVLTSLLVSSPAFLSGHRKG